MNFNFMFISALKNAFIHPFKFTICNKKNFPRQSFKIFTFYVKLSDSIFFLFSFSNRQINLI